MCFKIAIFRHRIFLAPSLCRLKFAVLCFCFSARLSALRCLPPPETHTYKNSMSGSRDNKRTVQDPNREPRGVADNPRKRSLPDEYVPPPSADPLDPNCGMFVHHTNFMQYMNSRVSDDQNGSSPRRPNVHRNIYKYSEGSPGKTYLVKTFLEGRFCEHGAKQPPKET